MLDICELTLEWTNDKEEEDNNNCPPIDLRRALPQVKSFIQTFAMFQQWVERQRLQTTINRPVFPFNETYNLLARLSNYL